MANLTKSLWTKQLNSTLCSAVKKYPNPCLTSYRFFTKEPYKLNTVTSSQNQNEPGLLADTFPPTEENSLKEQNTKEKSHQTEISETRLKKSLKHKDYFKVQNLVTVKELFDARVHLGHKSGCRNPHMKPYLFGSRLDVDIFDLDQTLKNLNLALNFAAHMAYRGGIILFISRHQQCKPLVETTAKDVREYAHCRHWKGGTFTNSENMFRFVTRLPDLCLFITTQNAAFEQHRAITDAAKLLIPSIGIVDSNCDPRLVSYPVPGNDDTPECIELYCKLFKMAIIRGKYMRKMHNLANESEKLPVSMFSF